MKHTELLKKLLDQTIEFHEKLEQEQKDSENFYSLRHKAIRDALGGKFYDFREVIEEIKRLKENQK